MDFLNKALNQLAELLRSMTPAARITTGLLLVVILISLGYLFNHPLSGADEFLFNGDSISSDQIPAMEGAFAKNNLSGYQIDGGRIRVPRGQRAAYMAALVDGKALPAVIGRKIDTDGSIFGETKDKREERRRFALQEELMLVIRNMRGIEKSSVLIDSQTEGGIKSKKTTTASVSVKPTGNQPLEEDRVPNLRHFVAAAVAGLSPDNVAVTDLNSGRTYANSSSTGGSGMGNTYAEVKRKYERDWEDKIRQALSYIPGVVVTANVELDTEVRHQERSIKYDSKIAATDTEETTSSNTQQSGGGGGNGGRPGVVANGANAPGAVSASSTSSGTHTQNENSKTVIRGLAPTTEIQSEKASLTPKYVSASVGVPSSYLDKLWQEKNPTPAGQEARKPTFDELAKSPIPANLELQIKTQIGGLFSNGAETKDKRGDVHYAVFQQIASDPIAGPGLADHAITWLSQSWTTLGMGFLGFFSLIVLRSIVRSPAGSATVTAAAPTTASAAAPAASNAESTAAESSSEEGGEEVKQPAAAPRRRRRANTGPTLKDELVDIVREDPDAAANILRAWIGSGA